MTGDRDPEDPDYINPDPDNWNWNWDPEVNDYVYVNPDNEDPKKFLCSY